MDRRVANNVVVGIFVTVAFFGLVWVLFNIGGGTGFMSSQYSLLGKFQEVKGLHTGSEVSLSGLRIGTVKEIKVSADSSKELVVEMAISKKMQERIRQDSTAMIKTQGMLGDKYIEISIGLTGDPLKHGSFIPTSEPPDLFAKSGNLVEGISSHFQKGGNVDELLKNLTVLSHNLSTLSTEMRTQKGLINELIYGNSGKSFNQSMNHVQSILAKVDRGDGTLGALINDPSVYEDLKYMMGGAKRSTILRYFMRQFIDSGEKEKEAAAKDKKKE